MKVIPIVGLLLILSGCEKFITPEKKAIPQKILKVGRCNEHGTCLVEFEGGGTGLMTRPSEGEYGCQSISQRAFELCEGPSDDE
ncbi:MAG: hypothetical protein H7249_09830 [Chitinophagaceae bacterium]|nr:hypothetical protein [Oligoflexus sp.]